MRIAGKGPPPDNIDAMLCVMIVTLNIILPIPNHDLVLINVTIICLDLWTCFMSGRLLAAWALYNTKGRK